MADIKLKDIDKLETWNAKELRKLKITINNRVNVLENTSKPKELKEHHPLYLMGPEECKSLLGKIQKAEKELSKS